MKKVLFPIMAVVLALALALPMAAVVGAAVDSVGTISDPGHPAGRSPQVAFAGCAVPEIVSAPSSVVQETYTSDTKIRVFDEQQNVVLGAGLNVDQTTDDITSSAVIPAGTQVDSHYIHLDNVGTTSGVRGCGYVTFDGDIIGVITQDGTLAASDLVLGAAGTTYPTSLTNRGLEQGAARTYQDIIWISGNTITLDLQVFNVLDSLRVITQEASITLTKSAEFPGDRAGLGEVITYTFEVENTGDVDFARADVSVVDPLIAPPDDPIGYDSSDTNEDDLLEPGETWTFSATHTVTEDDIANCMLENTATVTAWYNDAPYEDEDSALVPVAKMVNLWAGKYTDVGYVEIWNDGENVHVIYQIDDGMPWEITEVHLYVGDNAPPANTPGQFPYDIGDAVSVSPTTVEFSIPIAEIEAYMMELNKRGKPTGKMVVDGTPGVLPGDPIYVAAHSVVMDITCYQTGVVYGIERYTGNVYGVDVLSGASSLEFTITPPPALGSAKPNGLAYDPVNGRFYFVDYQPTTTLYFWDGTSQQTAGSLLLDAAGAPVGDIADADFYNGKYYFVTGPPSSDLLYEVAFNADGTASGPPTLIGNISAGAHGYTFNGDIAIKDGVIYGWGYCGIDRKYEFFSVNINGSGFTYVTPTYQTSLQLAFGSDGTLYGHRSGGTGEFFAVGTGIADFGDVTSIGWNVQGQLYTDCASGEICIPTTETAWGGWGDEISNRVDFDEPNWSNYLWYNLMNCEE